MKLDRFIVVLASDVDTCKALNWAWVSIRPFVLATGADERSVREEIQEQDVDIYVHDRSGR